MRQYLKFLSVGVMAGLLAACANVPDSIEFEEANRVQFAQVAQKSGKLCRRRSSLGWCYCPSGKS